MAGWGDWVKYLLNDGNCVCGNVCGIFGPAPNYQYYASDPSDFHPGVPFFQSMDKVFQSGVGACGSVRVSLPVDGAQKEFKFMILREDEKCITAKCGSDAGFNVSKTNNLYVVSFYTSNSVQPGNCAKRNNYVQQQLLAAGQ
ncbi:uncharacterized protein [Mytilus edulis]|uniref:uncharacterized protein n=1 Tax=Mytilus edulis TaxID=6550 RepID=UPI0039EE4EF9